MKRLLIAALLLGGHSAAVLAQGEHGARYSASGEANTSSATSEAMTDGEVRKIDKSTNKITLKHGELKNLDMPAMTMVFKVKDPAMLDQVKPGDKVRFSADRVNGAITVTTIEPAR